MKTFLHILALYVALVSALSCERMSMDSLEPIYFSVGEFSAEVKGQPVGDDFSGFGVFAVVNNPAYQSPVLLMNNDEVTNKGAYWGTDNVYYWPARAESTMNFYAYSPYAGQSSDYGLELSYNEGTGKPSLTFTMDKKTDVDLMVAKAEGRTAAYDPVELEFSHLLGKVQFMFSVSDEAGFSYVVKNVEIVRPKLQAEYLWENDQLNVSDISGSNDILIAGGDDFSYVVNSIEPEVIDAFTMCLIPGLLGTVKFQLNNEEPQVYDLSKLKVERNKILNLKMTVGVTGINIAPVLNDWLDGGSASDEIR